MKSRLSGSKLAITASAMCGALMAILDISIVNVALAEIRAAFATPLDQIAWISTGYMAANVVIIPMTGWLQRRHGYRRTFSAALLLFSAASVACAMSFSLPSLVLFRVVQGLGGGALIPTAQSMLFSRYPREEHGLAGALFGLGAISGPLLGPALGGYLIELAGWRWIFLVNVPLGLLAAALVLWQLREPAREEGAAPEPLDRLGLLLLVLSMASLQYVLEEGHRADWFESRTIVALSLLCAVSLSVFVVHELEAPHPVVGLRVFAGRGYRCASAINFLLGGAAFSASYLFALYCGVVMGYAAIDIGRVSLWGGALQFLLMPLIGVYGDRVDGRLLVGAGVVVTCLGLLLYTGLTEHADLPALVRPGLVLSVGVACLYIPVSVAALSDLPEEERGNATGLFNLTRELGGSIGTACMSVTLTDRGRLHGQHLLERLSPAAAAFQEQFAFIKGGAAALVSEPELAAYRLIDLRVRRQALVMAFHDAYLLVALGLSLSLLLLWGLRRPARTGGRALGH